MRKKSHIGKKEFEVLYRKYYLKITAFALRHLKDKAQAQDLAHDAFLRVWEKRSQFHLETDIRPLLFKIIRDLVASHYKRNLLHDEAIQLAQLTVSSESKELKVHERMKMLKETVAKLPPKRRKVFELKQWQGLSYQEIADELSISKNTVEVHLTKARQFIREQLAQ